MRYAILLSYTLLVCGCSGSATNGAYGASCTSSQECGHGNCVDGYCCNTDCPGQCEACNVAGSEGACTVVTGVTHGNRAPCAGSGVCGGTCDGVTAATCVYPTVECAAATCLEGTETLAATCDGAGACPAGQTEACSPYVCGTTACKTSCDGDDASCSAGHYCSAGTCVPKLDDGTTCTANNQCTSDRCVDGVCCNSACSAQCEACNVLGSEGTCSPASGAPVGGRTACVTDGTACGGACNGVLTTACTYPVSECRTASCSDGTETAAANCNGAGACPTIQTVTCTPYVCGTTACHSSCTSDAQCIAADYCSAGTCVPKLAAGQECTADNQCGDTLTCLQGQVGHKYCGSPSCGTCRVVKNDGITCENATDGTDPKSECTDATYGPETCVSGACAITCLPNLISYWNFDDSTVNDSVGSYNGEIATGTYVDSYVGKGVYTGRQCSGGDRSGARVANFLDFASDSFSIELSHKPACSGESWQLYALFTTGPATTPGVSIINQTTTPYSGGDLYKFRYAIVNASGGQLEIGSATTTFSCSTSHHVVAIRDRALGQMRLYVDGALENEALETVGDLRPNTTVYIGGVNFEGGCGWGQSAGTMDAAAFYQRALTSDDVAALYARWQAGKLVCGP